MSDKQITSIVLHYNRPQNVPKWMAGIRQQTVPSDVWVWDNSGNYPAGHGEDVLFRTTKNLYCQPRFLMMGAVQTPYVFHTDDDLAIKDRQLFEKLLAYSKKYPNAVIGWNGRLFHKDINWEKAYSFPNIGKGGGWVDYDVDEKFTLDMINTGVSFWPTHLINQVHINPFQNCEDSITDENFRFGDDMYISHYLKEKRVMPYRLRDSFDWLDEGKTSLSKQGRHMINRDMLCKKWWKAKYE